MVAIPGGENQLVDWAWLCAHYAVWCPAHAGMTPASYVAITAVVLMMAWTRSVYDRPPCVGCSGRFRHRRGCTWRDR